MASVRTSAAAIRRSVAGALLFGAFGVVAGCAAPGGSFEPAPTTTSAVDATVPPVVADAPHATTTVQVTPQRPAPTGQAPPASTTTTTTMPAPVEQQVPSLVTGPIQVDATTGATGNATMGGSAPGALVAALVDTTSARHPAVLDELVALAELTEPHLGGPGVAVVDHRHQMLWVFDGTSLTTHAVSTGKGGISNRPASSGTPAGRHRVDWVVRGALGEIVRGFGPTGRFPGNTSTAYMTTRAFGLVGLEPGNSNSQWRGIFLHGTNVPDRLGRPVSGGCIRVGDLDAVFLDGILQVGSLVSIVAD